MRYLFIVLFILFPMTVMADELPFIQYELPSLEGYETRPWIIKEIGWVTDLTQPEEPEVCVVQAEVMTADDPRYQELLKKGGKTEFMYLFLELPPMDKRMFETSVENGGCAFLIW